MEPTKQFIQALIGNELAYINTRHPDFADARNQVSLIFIIFRFISPPGVPQSTDDRFRHYQALQR